MKQEIGRVQPTTIVGSHSWDTLRRYRASHRNAGLPNGRGGIAIDFGKSDSIGRQVANSPDSVDQFGNRDNIGRDLASVGGHVDERTVVR